MSTKDESESVDDFLARIASISNKQDGEDIERSRRMEEDMLKARKERQARRAERARSLSPSKTGPAPSIPSLSESRPMTIRSIEPPVALTPRSQTQTPNARHAPAPRALPNTPELPRPQTPLEKPSSPTPPPLNASTLSRSGTLSWQQRPTSRDSNTVRSRPLSRRSPSPRNTPPNASPEREAEGLSRKDIADSLGAKDPAWFRQTQDRGGKSPAYRREVSEEVEPAAYTSRGMRLPGLSDQLRPSSSEPERRLDKRATSDEPSARVPATLTPKAPREQLQTATDEATTPTAVRPTQPRLASPIILEPTTLKPLDSKIFNESESSSLTRSSSILSTSGRPPSPTKGLGGFVESAMMKRSDSVNKRWSVQANAGLKRGDSVASSRPTSMLGAAGGFSARHNRTSSKEPRSFREGTSSPLTSSRPTSSHESDMQPLQSASLPPKSLVDHVEQRPASPLRIEHSPIVDDHKAQGRPTTPPMDSVLSRSPSKTLDSRRWSPTKSSWLESALAKPDPARPAMARPDPPAWKLDMQRSKAEKEVQRGLDTGPSLLEAIGETEDPPSLPDNNGKKDSSLAGHRQEETEQQAESHSPPIRTVSGEEARPKPIVKPKQLKFPNEASESTATPEHKSVLPAKSEPVETEKVPQLHSVPDSIIDRGPKSEALSEPRVRAEPDFKPALEALTKSSAATNPISSSAKPKPKPQTPPKVDFRANLKSRNANMASSNEKEPEFKAVFGKLKRAQTQNYVAPDVLKDNISRGKAGLSVTAGPQKTERVDEFKDSILQKKEAMKSGGGSIRQRGKSVNGPDPSPEDSIPDMPEALARRKTLHKTNSSKDEVPTLRSSRDVMPKPAVSAGNISSAQALPEKTSTKTSAKFDTDTQPLSKAIRLATTTPTAPLKASDIGSNPHEVPTSISHQRATQATESVVDNSDSTSKAFPMPLKKEISASSKLAARLNPALAGLISRGSSPKPTSESSMPTSTLSTPAQNDPAGSQDVDGGSGGDLTHMTKGRAKGPKRRAPKQESNLRNDSVFKPLVKTKSVADASEGAGPMSRQSEDTQAMSTDARESVALDLRPTLSPEPIIPEHKIPLVVRPLPTPKPATLPNPVPSTSRPLPSPKPEAKKLGFSSEIQHQADSLDPTALPPTQAMAQEYIKAKPIVAAKSPEVRKVSNPSTKPLDEKSSSRPATPRKFDIAIDRALKGTSLAEADVMKDTIASRTPATTPLTPSKSRLNSKPQPDLISKPTTTLPSTNRMNGLGLDLSTSHKKSSVAAPELTPPPDKDFKAAPARRGLQVEREAAVQQEAAKQILAKSFTSIPILQTRAEFDTEKFLASQTNNTDKSRTISNQIWEVNGDGKKVAMPPQQEHILFEESMYLCVHTFEAATNKSKTSAVYLWCGDGVAEAAVEDAQLFCRKVARENSAKLEVMKQGKESSDFFQALGGIVIIRRSKSSALYMLCGRRHLGHVAFDEVDLSAENLCSGFPFLISAKFGKLYLWKGHGSGADEVGCARLIGMDLGLTGEIEEVTEGEEQASFWEAFPSPHQTKSKTTADIWQHRDHHKGYATRLYRVEHDRPKSSGGFWGLRASSPPKSSNKAVLEEIVPFSQKDLDPNHFYILDAYVHVYVLVGAKTSTKPTEFATALSIAREISVLTPSVQDRSLLPICYVVFGELPADAQVAFRKWVVAAPNKMLDGSTAPSANINAMIIEREMGR